MKRGKKNGLAVITTLLTTGVLLLTLPGCFPYVTSYVHLEASGITNTSACTGPPVFANYEAKGAYFAVTVGPSLFAGVSAGFLTVRAPQEMVVSMHEAIGYLTPEGQAPIRFALQSVEQ